MSSLEGTYFLRKIYTKTRKMLGYGDISDYDRLSWNVRYPEDYLEDYANANGEQFSAILQKRIVEQQPTLVTRFGSDIMMCALSALNKPTLLNRFRYITDRRDSIGLQPWVVETMTNNAGFYSEKEEYLERDLYKYGELINSIVPEIDMLATVLRQERFYSNYFDTIPKCFLPNIEPYRQKNPWTKALMGKRVLVIHPF